MRFFLKSRRILKEKIFKKLRNYFFGRFFLKDLRLLIFLEKNMIIKINVFKVNYIYSALIKFIVYGVPVFRNQLKHL